MPRIVKRPEAENDLIAIFVYLGPSSRATAERFLRAADRAFQGLAAMPELGSIGESDHPDLAELRLWPIRGFRKYLIWYRPLADGIEVKRVLHGSREIENLFRAPP